MPSSPLSSIPNRVETLRVLRLMGDYDPILMLVGSDAAKDHCLEEIAELINPLQDDVRCYPLPARGFQGRIGVASLPAGIGRSAGSRCSRRLRAI